jgi:hypothetical protein
MWLDYYESCKTGRCSNLCLKIFLLLVGIFLGLSVGYVRIVLGVHSLCQVGLGWVLGLWYVFILHYLVKPRFTEHVKELLECKAEFYVAYLITIIISFIVFNATSMILYKVLDSYYIEIETLWLEQITAKGCGAKIEGGFQVLGF